MAEAHAPPGKTVVLGERELVIGFRLLGLRDVVEVTPESSAAEFEKAVSNPEFNLIVASYDLRQHLSEGQRARADASLHPLVVFVPSRHGTYAEESISDLAKRILGISPPGS